MIRDYRLDVLLDGWDEGEITRDMGDVRGGFRLGSGRCVALASALIMTFALKFFVFLPVSCHELNNFHPM